MNEVYIRTYFRICIYIYSTCIQYIDISIVQHALSPAAEIEPFVPKLVASEECLITSFQKRYFYTQSFEEATEKMRCVSALQDCTMCTLRAIAALSYPPQRVRELHRASVRCALQRVHGARGAAGQRGERRAPCERHPERRAPRERRARPPRRHLRDRATRPRRLRPRARLARLAFRRRAALNAIHILTPTQLSSNLV